MRDPLKSGGARTLRVIRGLDEVRITRSLPNYYPVLWKNGLDEFERVLRDELCKERGPNDDLGLEKLPEIKKQWVRKRRLERLDNFLLES